MDFTPSFEAGITLFHGDTLMNARRFLGKLLLNCSCSKHVPEKPAEPLGSSKPLPCSPQTHMRHIPLSAPG